MNNARKLLEEVIRDFPFVDASDRAHALCLMILPFVRPMIDGPTPVHFITKPVQGTGATLLGEVVTMIKTGKPRGRVVLHVETDVVEHTPSGRRLLRVGLGEPNLDSRDVHERGACLLGIAVWTPAV